MVKITDISQIKVDKFNHLFYQNKRIDKWWGKTLYYFDPKSKDLQSRNFTLFGLLFHHFGYKSKYNESGLCDWLQSKNVKLISDHKLNENVAIRSLNDVQNFKATFKEFSISKNQNSSLLEFIKKPLDLGMDPNMILDKAGTTLLHHAVRSDYPELVELLIEKGAKVSRMDSHGMTPLMLAVSLGHERIARLILEKGNFPKEQNNLLYLSVFYNRLPLVKLFVEYGADIHLKHQHMTEKLTILEVARKHDFTEIVRYLESVQK